MPAVSVIIPTLNRKSFLERSVQSVRNQSYTDLECIVIDGGSTDGTREFLDEIENDRFHVLRRDEPKGLSNARNAGLELATGEYIVFLDDDDRLYEAAIETLVETLESRAPGCAGVYTAQRQVDDTGKTTTKSIRAGKVEDFEGKIGGPSCTIVRADVIDEIGPFDESFPALEDQEFWIRVFSRYWLYGIDRPLYERNLHDGQLTNDAELMMRGDERVLEKHGEHLLPSLRANRNYSIAHQQARMDHPGTARPYVRKAIREYPWRLAFYYYHFWLLFGTVGYALGRELHLKLYRPIVDSVRAEH